MPVPEIGNQNPIFRRYFGGNRWPTLCSFALISWPTLVRAVPTTLENLPQRHNSSVLFPTVFASSCHFSPPVIPGYRTDSQPWLAVSAHRERHSSYLGAAHMLHLPSRVLVVQDEPSKTSCGARIRLVMVFAALRT